MENKNNIVGIYMFFNGIINDAFPLRPFNNRQTRITFNLLLELQNESFKEERYRYHENQFLTGYYIVEYNTSIEIDDHGFQSKFRRFSKLPPEYSGLVKKEFSKLTSFLRGETVQLKPSDYGCSWDVYTPSILVKIN